MSSREPINVAAPEMTVEATFHISGRGTVITGPATGRFEPGDLITCGDITATVTGVERFAIPNPPYTPASLIIRHLKQSDFQAGQVWRRTGTEK